MNRIERRRLLANRNREFRQIYKKLQTRLAEVEAKTRVKEQVKQLKTKYIALLLLLSITGCNLNTPRPEYFRTKLNNMIGMNNQLGAVVGYNTQKFNGPGFVHERYYQNMRLPTNQFEWQLNYMTNSKIKGKYGI